MKHIISKVAMPILILLLVVTFLPWTSDVLFNTKGEPREAIVAVSMLQSGEWVLPMSFGEEIPYKPPFLAWCIAAVSMLTGGITEFSSRLPSMIAVMCLVVSTFLFFRKRIGLNLALLTALIAMTSVEVWRAGWACRVDMLLTAFMVGAIYRLYIFFDKRGRGLPAWAILLMSCAVLTKGPVGMLLPCLSVGIYRLLRGDRFWPLFLRLAASGVLSCVVPAIWYVMAYNIGGDTFLNLAMEENFGRFMGKMGYESHENPAYYNVITVVAGMLPYTLLALLGLIGVAAAKRGRLFKSARFARFETLKRRIREADKLQLFALTVTLVIFIFYCIPKSKRSVYLLPIYPFLAYYVALLINVMAVKYRRALVVYGSVINVVVALMVLFALTLAVADMACPEMFSSMPAQVVRMARRCSDLGGIIVMVVALGISAYAFASLRRKPYSMISGFMMSTIVAYWMIGFLFLPPILNAKSDKMVAEAIERHWVSGPVYSYVDSGMVRFYTVNFYLDDSVREFERANPSDGIMIVGKHDFDAWQKRFGDSYKVEDVMDLGHRSCDLRQPVLLVEFVRK